MPSVRAVRCTSVVPAAHVPVLPRMVVINAIHAIVHFLLPLFAAENLRLKMDLHVPFILPPRVFPPPISRTAPRPRSGGNLPAQTSKINSCRKFLAHLHPRHPFRTKNAQRQSRFCSRIFSSPHRARPRGSSLVFNFLFARAESFHADRFRPMRIQNRRCSHVRLASQILQPRQSELEVFCVH